MLNWSGQTAIILASGPSLTIAQCLIAERSGFPIIVTNATFRICKPTVIYIGDYAALRQYVPEAHKLHPKVPIWTQDANGADRWAMSNVHFVKGKPHEGLNTKPGQINTNANSGFSALNLAYLFGARRFLLAGFDMQLGPDGEKHWHDDHPRPLVQDLNLVGWINRSARLAHDLREQGCEVINCSRETALKCWPRGDLEEEIAK